MLRMIRFEFQKMFGRAVVIGALAVLVFISFILLKAYCFNTSRTTAYLPDGTTLSGREAILYHQSVAGKYEGDFTDEAVARMVSDFAEEYPKDFYGMTHDGSVNASLPSAYLYLPMFLPPQNYDEILREAAGKGTAISPLTEYGLISMREYMPLADESLQYGYSDSWELFFLSFFGPVAAIATPVLIVIILAVSTVFSGEYSMKTAPLILTTKYGKSRQITAKLLASLIFATLLMGFVFALFCIAFGLQYGLAGWNADMQTNFGLCGSRYCPAGIGSRSAPGYADCFSCECGECPGGIASANRQFVDFCPSSPWTGCWGWDSNIGCAGSFRRYSTQSISKLSRRSMIFR